MVARTDDDSWDITKSVGATALRVAAARAAETRSANRLIDDPYAQLFLEAVGESAWSASDPLDQHESDPQLSAIEQSGVDYTASRTKFLDDFFLAAINAGLRQTVILAAGLDSRAWRLPWPDATIVYEIDQPTGCCNSSRKPWRHITHNPGPGTSLCQLTCATIGQKPCRKLVLIHHKRPHGRPKGCCITFPPPRRICYLTAFRH